MKKSNIGFIFEDLLKESIENYANDFVINRIKFKMINEVYEDIKDLIPSEMLNERIDSFFYQAKSQLTEMIRDTDERMTRMEQRMLDVLRHLEEIQYHGK